MMPRLPGRHNLLPEKAEADTAAVGHSDDRSLTQIPAAAFSTNLFSETRLDVFLGMSMRQVRPPAQLPNTLNCPPQVSPRAFAHVRHAPHPS